ncbi:MAG: STAS domain-containing protein [Candidatus Marinimicrobia bacterium]|nr:STAS domain-containing protein [Candidatus Neomarinimicrobiota bacterium]
MNVRFEIRQNGGVVILGGALSAANVDTFRDQMHNWLQDNPGVRRVVLDLTAMDFIDSAGLGVLISLLKYVSEREGDIRLAGLQRRARMVFEITRTYKIFEIFDTVDEALTAEA